MQCFILSSAEEDRVYSQGCYVELDIPAPCQACTHTHTHARAHLCTHTRARTASSTSLPRARRAHRRTHEPTPLIIILQCCKIILGE